jgi:hypothetical protein
MLMVDQLKSHTPKYQQLIMDNFVFHPLVNDFLPPYLANMEVLKQSQAILGNLREALTFHLVGSHQFKLVMAKDIVCTLASCSHDNNINTNKGIVRIWGVDRRNIKKGLD